MLLQAVQRLLDLQPIGSFKLWKKLEGIMRDQLGKITPRPSISTQLLLNVVLPYVEDTRVDLLI